MGNSNDLPWRSEPSVSFQLSTCGCHASTYWLYNKRGLGASSRCGPCGPVQICKLEFCSWPGYDNNNQINRKTYEKAKNCPTSKASRTTAQTVHITHNSPASRVGLRLRLWRQDKTTGTTSCLVISPSFSYRAVASPADKFWALPAMPARACVFRLSPTTTIGLLVADQTRLLSSIGRLSYWPTHTWKTRRISF